MEVMETSKLRERAPSLGGIATQLQLIVKAWEGRPSITRYYDFLRKVRNPD
jgi:hypothetical protein